MESPRIVLLAMFAVVVFGSVETAVADSLYSFTTFDGPGARATIATGINDSGQIVGGFSDALGGHGFLDTGGSFTTIDVPGASGTLARGINDSGQIVGTSSLGAFLYTGGSLTTIDVPGAIVTYALGINDSGQIVGFFKVVDLGVVVHRKEKFMKRLLAFMLGLAMLTTTVVAVYGQEKATDAPKNKQKNKQKKPKTNTKTKPSVAPKQ